MITASAGYNTANAALAKTPIFVITISSYSRAFSNAPLTDIIGGAAIFDWLVSIEDLQETVNDLDGGTNLADLIFTVQDGSPLLPNAITADFPGFTFEGKTATLLQGYSGMALADYVTLFTSRIDSVEGVNSNLEYTFSCPDIRSDLSQVIFVEGDDGKPIGSAHPRTLLGHPLDLLLNVLETECAYTSAQVDEATITTYRDTVYSGATMKFSLESAPTAIDFIESELLKPLCGYLRSDNLGRITVVFAYPLAFTTVFDFNPSNLIEIPEAGQADLINEVTVRMDDSGSTSSATGFATEVTKTYAPSVAKFGMFGQQIIESKGLRSGLNGVALGAQAAFLIFLRYGMKALCCGDNGKNVSSNPVNAIWTAALVEPGDFVTLTHPQVPDRVAGVLGVTGKTFVVMDRTWQFFLGNVQYKLIEIDLATFTIFLITLDGEGAYTAVSSGDQRALMFLSNDSDQYSNADPANTLA